MRSVVLDVNMFRLVLSSYIVLKYLTLIMFIDF